MKKSIKYAVLAVGQQQQGEMIINFCKYYTVALLTTISVLAFATPVEGIIRVSLDQALNSPSYSLAQAYLITSYNLLAAKTASRIEGLTIYTFIDGQAETINKSNADVYISGFEERLQIYADAIRKRGFQKINGEYNTSITSECKTIGFVEGEKTVIDQDEFQFSLAHGDFQGKIRHQGVTVESSL
ncbi:hypothetical protein Nos7524_1088 [Nostoc sp. PCC 7524]|uniref:hypothetical protein n=1 Tax=Nostoc sp. (strain ATCC 29411 / PCC 7524) TaxID=28072 RepID=UPI00029F1198|nr:hypothetical protein [Nostoc sp. PCC 7524]AFY46981.1 hypothetical protein Nos7524_1088 [Nostoc sp. PCC 7524]